jgi:hypothetical protein
MLSEPIPDLRCSFCDGEHKYDPVMGWGCLVLLDQREAPNSILGAWCDEVCLHRWLDSAEAMNLLAPRM